jgi:hypothetical protein
MATTNFSGPITAGQIRNTTGTTLGENIKNIGQVLMAQLILLLQDLEVIQTTQVQLEQLLKFFLQMISLEQFKQLTQLINLLVWLHLELMLQLLENNLFQLQQITR